MHVIYHNNTFYISRGHIRGNVVDSFNRWLVYSATIHHPEWRPARKEEVEKIKSVLGSKWDDLDWDIIDGSYL